MQRTRHWGRRRYPRSVHRLFFIHSAKPDPLDPTDSEEEKYLAHLPPAPSEIRPRFRLTVMGKHAAVPCKISGFQADRQRKKLLRIEICIGRYRKTINRENVLMLIYQTKRSIRRLHHSKKLSRHKYNL